jgi:hypothetical protein
MPIATGKPRWLREIDHWMFDIARKRAEEMELDPHAPWIGHVTAEEERRRAEDWARNMGTGYPSVRDAGGLVDNHDQEPSGEAEGQEVEAAGARDSQSCENKQDEAKHE